MNKPIILAMFFLVLISGTGWAQPCVEMETRSYVVPGLVNEGQEVIGAFQVQNTGDETLSIIQVTPSCGCLVSFFDTLIPPGAKGRIDLKLDTRYLHGLVKRKAIVVTNDPGSPKILIEMTAEVR